MKVRILHSARKDMMEAYHFYERQADGLGTYFLDVIFSDIDSLQFFAGIYAPFFKDYRRLLSKRFPFAIYYLLENEKVSVHAVLDCRRHPAWIRKKLS
ncbi:type II toxin-antitoxin system RelE/ParE family toxin [Desulfobotulus mexicanus]|uniref:Type II toxin-antitoxin system RelE/ParE family toxin n=1 Tax=Desulfobotulus mexicanus TaxID=2586642 RepID=A0A5Q4VB25_9BACT|nr:type II toxin-antitoxin system RelE/ParE family toxin [Desulfobotulus mexicanus]TYT74954.1 type II toxin-antitoxin system RelE/ParE family toxin [Desulfobotulus mexicanus]